MLANFSIEDKKVKESVNVTISLQLVKPLYDVFSFISKDIKKNLDKKKKTKFPATKCINRQMIFLYFKEQAIYNVNLSSQCNTCSSTFASYLVLTLIKHLSVLAINKSLFGFNKKDVNKKWLFCICKNKINGFL